MCYRIHYFLTENIERNFGIRKYFSFLRWQRQFGIASKSLWVRLWPASTYYEQLQILSFIILFKEFDCFKCPYFLYVSMLRCLFGNEFRKSHISQANCKPQFRSSILKTYRWYEWSNSRKFFCLYLDLNEGIVFTSRWKLLLVSTLHYRQYQTFYRNKNRQRTTLSEHGTPVCSQVIETM